MKKSFMLKTLFMAIITSVIVLACKKDKVIIIQDGSPKTSKFNSFNSWKSSLKDPVQNFKVNGSAGTTIVGDRGYRFYFAPGSLLDNMGKPITGTVNVKLTEVTNPADMLATGARTEAVDGILGSAGMFNLELNYNGNPAYINPSKPVKAEVMSNPDADLSNVKVFNGQLQSDSTGDTTVKWRNQDSSFQKYLNYDSLKKVYDSIQKEYLQKRCIKFDLYFGNWCNLDAYFNSPTGAPVRVKAENTKGNKDTRVFMYLTNSNLKGFYELRRDITDPEEFNSTYYNLPIGWKMLIVVVTRTQKDEVQFETKEVTNASGTVHVLKNRIGITDENLEKFFRSL